MSFCKEFKAFVMRGNVVDLAIAVIIGAAFGKVISSFVSDVLMPPIGLLLGGVDFKSLMITLQEASGDQPAVAIKYGLFLNTVIDFIIIAFAIFLVIKALSKLQREAPPQAPNTKDCPECKMAIPVQAKRCGHCCSMIPSA